MHLSEVEKKDIEYILKNTSTEFSVLEGKTLLITGAAGFLGYYFIKSILTWNDSHKKKIHLIINSRFTNGLPKWIKEVKERNDVEIIKKDVTALKISEKKRIDYIIHAASIASPIVYRKYPLETMHANVQGLTNLLEYARKRKATKKPVEGVLYFSSSEIYGDPTPENIPTPETYRGNVSCTGPRACYDESKRYCETLCVNYTSVHNLPIKVARPFNNYGPGLRISDGRVIPDFANNILHNENIVMFSNGSPQRTFCYIADAISGYFKVLVSGKPGEAYNIGVEKPEISIRELAELMVVIGRKKYGYKGDIVIKASGDKHYLTDNPNRRQPIIKKAKKDIHYNPKIPLKEGLDRSMEWYSNNLL